MRRSAWFCTLLIWLKLDFAAVAYAVIPLLCCWSNPACVQCLQDALVSSPVCPCKLLHDGQSQLGSTAASVGLLFPGESAVEDYTVVGRGGFLYKGLSIQGQSGHWLLVEQAGEGGFGGIQ